MQPTTTGWQRSLYQAAAFDGRWSRTLWGYDPQNPQGLDVTLPRGTVKIDDGGRDGIFVYRPHNLMVRDMSIFSSLAGLLASPRYERPRTPHPPIPVLRHGRRRRPSVYQSPR